MNVPSHRIDSDEEPPAAVAHASLIAPHQVWPPAPFPSGASFGGFGAESQMLGELCERLRNRYQLMTVLPTCVPDVVPFCVAEKRFAVSRALLEKDPGSLLFILTAEHFAAPLASHSACTAPERTRTRSRAASAAESTPGGPIAIPSRNPQLFAMLLNLLRGYRNAVPPDWMDSCRDEALYYGLTTSWNTRFQISPATYYFRSPLHHAKLVSDAVLGIASDFFVSGEHHIDFSVAQCDRVAVGMMSATTGLPEELGSPVQDGNNGAFYWNDGKLSFYLGDSRVVETGFPFPAGAIVRVVFDADSRLVRWVVNGEYCVAMERLPAGRSYAFASIASRSSQVAIAPT